MLHRPINRYLEDKWMDHIDHALGRPLDPLGETYRNLYATDGPLADEMATSPFWIEGSTTQGGMRYFHVTEAGCRALAEHLKVIGDKNRAFLITFDKFERTVIATSRSKARYHYFLDITDSFPDLDFKAYCKRVSVRATAPVTP